VRIMLLGGFYRHFLNLVDIQLVALLVLVESVNVERGALTVHRLLALLALLSRMRYRVQVRLLLKLIFTAGPDSTSRILVSLGRSRPHENSFLVFGFRMHSLHRFGHGLRLLRVLARRVACSLSVDHLTVVGGAVVRD